MLGLEPHLGRLIQPDDDVVTGRAPDRRARLPLLGELVRRRPRSVVGRELRIGGRPYTIVGVAPEEYSGRLRGIDAAIYAPMMMIDQLQADRRRASSRSAATTRASSRRDSRPAPPWPTRRARSTRWRRGLDRAAGSSPGTLNGGFTLKPSAEVVVMPQLDRWIRAAAWLLSAVVGPRAAARLRQPGELSARPRHRPPQGDGAAPRAGRRPRRAGGTAPARDRLLLALARRRRRRRGRRRRCCALLQGADLPLPVPLTLDLDLDWGVLAFTMGISLLAGLALGLAPGAPRQTATIWPRRSRTTRRAAASAGAPGCATRWWWRRSRSRRCSWSAPASSCAASSGCSRSIPGSAASPRAVISFLIPSDRYDAEAARQMARTSRGARSRDPRRRGGRA